MKIAIIGSGIAGLGAAYLLSRQHAITLYEKNNYIGGHSCTIDIQDNERTLPVDIGFIVFNHRNYPHLCGLFDHLKVPVEKSDMSFGVSINNGWLEYSSNGLFAQKVNLLRVDYWRMIGDILRFNLRAHAYLDAPPTLTLNECLTELGMRDWFQRYYLLAMGAAIWSCPIETILRYPARTFLQFFKNHGLLTVHDQPQWYTVRGGSREYVRRLTASFKKRIHFNCGVEQVDHQDGRVYVHDTQGDRKVYDQVIFACHADEARNMLPEAPSQTQSVLEAFRFQTNRVVVHRDESFMPHRRACWASWVYLSEAKTDLKPVVSLTYWMNNLQNFRTDPPILVTLNPGRQPRDDLIVAEHMFDHPVFDARALAAQEKIADIQGQNNMWFCGAYQRYGFHEDGLLSAVQVCRAMGVDIPWM